MARVAVVAHAGKSFGGGLEELRSVLAGEGYPDPLRRAVTEGADIVFVWGGDGTVQQCIDAVAGTGAVVAILPAGTSNLLAANLGVPTDLTEAVRIGLHGQHRPLDTGSVNGEHFTVMAGAGFDALMIKEADAGMKDRVGRVAYLWTGARNLNARRVKATITVDGRAFFKGRISCVLVANVGKVVGGIEAFSAARPDDGLLDLGVVTAKNPIQWTRTLGRMALGETQKSPFVETTRGKTFTIRFDRRFPYELDGGARPASKRLRIKVHPSSIRICVPAEAE
jgi:diacylglycerol kinase (ATP)